MRDHSQIIRFEVGFKCTFVFPYRVRNKGECEKRTIIEPTQNTYTRNVKMFQKERERER